MNECTVFYSNPSDSTCGTPPPVESRCTDCCNCGYLQYESLFPYLAEIKSSLKDTQDKGTEFEFRLREQIVEISRLFDIEAGVAAGYFTKAHYQTTKIYPTHGTKYIKVPEFVSGTLDVRTIDNQLLSGSSFGFQDGFLVYHPCSAHGYTDCEPTCGSKKSRSVVPWPNECYQITARWGKECADAAVQMAVRDYLIESYRVKDPIAVMTSGLPISRGFQVPHSWSTYLRNFKAKRALYSQFAFA